MDLREKLGDGSLDVNHMRSHVCLMAIGCPVDKEISFCFLRDYCISFTALAVVKTTVLHCKDFHFSLYIITGSEELICLFLFPFIRHMKQQYIRLYATGSSCFISFSHVTAHTLLTLHNYWIGGIDLFVFISFY